MQKCGCRSSGWHLRVYRMVYSLKKPMWWVAVLWTVLGFRLLCPSWQLLHAYLYVPLAMQKKSVWGKCKRCMPTSIVTLCNARSLGQPLMLYCQAFIHDGFYDLLLHVKMCACMCKQINFFPPPISGHLVWPAGRYSVLVGCPTLEWIPSPLSSSWRQGSGLGNLPMPHAQMRCEALDCSTSYTCI